MSFYNRQFLNRWFKLSSIEQLANIGAEVCRAINWRKKGNLKLAQPAFYRALDLIDASVEDKKNQRRLKEFLRLRELLVDDFAGENIYHSTDEQWEKYFYYFNFAANKLK